MLYNRGTLSYFTFMIITLIIIALIIGLAYPLMKFAFNNAWPIVIVIGIIVLLYYLFESFSSPKNTPKQQPAPVVKPATVVQDKKPKKPAKKSKAWQIVSRILLGLAIYVFFALLFQMIISPIPVSAYHEYFDFVFWASMILPAILGCLPLAIYLIKSFKKKNKKPRK